MANAVDDGPRAGRRGPAPRDALRGQPRRRDRTLPARGRRQARAPDAHAAHRAARRRHQPEGPPGGRGDRDHPPRLALPRRRHGRRADAPRRPERAVRVGQLGRRPHRRPAVRPRQQARRRRSASGPSSSRPTRSSACASGSCTRPSARRRAKTRSSTTSGCSQTRPVRSSPSRPRWASSSRTRPTEYEQPVVVVRREDRRRLPAHRRRHRPLVAGRRRDRQDPGQRPARRRRHPAGAATARARRRRIPKPRRLLERLERDVIGTADDGEVTPGRLDADRRPARPRRDRQTLDEAHRWAREAVEALAPLPDGPVKKALVRFADTIVERSS